jgi:predicted RNA-binding Zn-ribbon protein involved in translation (DUF1610 family)
LRDASGDRKNTIRLKNNKIIKRRSKPMCSTILSNDGQGNLRIVETNESFNCPECGAKLDLVEMLSNENYSVKRQEICPCCRKSFYLVIRHTRPFQELRFNAFPKYSFDPSTNEALTELPSNIAYVIESIEKRGLNKEYFAEDILQIKDRFDSIIYNLFKCIIPNAQNADTKLYNKEQIIKAFSILFNRPIQEK